MEERLRRALGALCAGALVVAALAGRATNSPRYAPAEFRAIYLSSWSATIPERVTRAVMLEREGEINAIVIDIKDATGHVAFDTSVAAAETYGAERVLLRDVEGLVARLHREGLYVIARLVVFSDSKLAEARPDLGIHSRSEMIRNGGSISAETLWRDNRGFAWVDPASEEAWSYNAAIARDALNRGFDEINFDYIRFPSDGSLNDAVYPVWRGKTARRVAISRFYGRLRELMGASVISADLFGLSTVNHDDLGIGQVIEDAFSYFDYVCPMVYPSHYASGFVGRANPAAYPYEVVYRSLRTARGRLAAVQASGERRAKLRPWLQDFERGAPYDPGMVEAQVKASRDALEEGYAGFSLWDPNNVYRGLAANGGSRVSRAAD